MASALLASRNEAYFGERDVYMRKKSDSFSHLLKSSKNPKRNPNITNIDDSTTSSAAPALSVNSSSLNHHHEEYVRFRIAGCSRGELRDLKRRLVSELEQVRTLSHRIESSKKVRSMDDPGKHLSEMMKKCGRFLSKLMKKKNSWVFNVPVDVDGMRLHDYYQIIKHPMDLGTVKRKLFDNLYHSPLDFSSDVRLTFKNALMYNPKGHDVYNMAQEMLNFFVEMFDPAFKVYEAEHQMIVGDANVGVQRQRTLRRVVGVAEDEMEMTWSRIPTTPDSARRPTTNKPIVPRSIPIPEIVRKPPDSIQHPNPKPIPNNNVPYEFKSALLKKGKPKARDPNKREMTFEEKRKLSFNLQDIPQEKMDNVVQIIRKRNPTLSQDGDEIELDIEVLDTETLWELDRFITNHKKFISKMNRLAVHTDKSPVSDMVEVAAKRSENGEMGRGVEEEVDIGDEMPATAFPSVEIAKDAGGASRSSSSSSSSSSDGSSSSDSDSGSSSGSDSDAGDGGVGSKVSPRS